MFYDCGARIPMAEPATPMRKSEVVDKVDKEVELSKGENCQNWPSKSKFLENFQWKRMIDELKVEVGEKEAESFAVKLKELF